MHKNVEKFILCPLLICFMIISILAPAARAKMIDTQAVLAERTDSPLASIQAFLDRSDVRNQLVLLGVDPVRAGERVAALTNQELQQLQARINDLPAGGMFLQ